MVKEPRICSLAQVTLELMLFLLYHAASPRRQSGVDTQELGNERLDSGADTKAGEDEGE